MSDEELDRQRELADLAREDRATLTSILTVLVSCFCIGFLAMIGAILYQIFAGV